MWGINMYEGIKDIIQEKITSIKKDIKEKFAYDGEKPEQYERVLKKELEEHIKTCYTEIIANVDYQGCKTEMNFGEKIVKESEFRKAVIDEVFPLALEHTEAFKIEEGNNKATNNIKKILEYSPHSIDTIMPVIIKLDEKNLDIILKEYPQFEDKITNSIKQNEEDDKHKGTIIDEEYKETLEKLKRLKEMTAKFQELVNGMENTGELEHYGQEKTESQGGIRAQLKDVLKGYMEVLDGYDELEGSLTQKCMSNEFYK